MIISNKICLCTWDTGITLRENGTVDPRYEHARFMVKRFAALLEASSVKMNAVQCLPVKYDTFVVHNKDSKLNKGIIYKWDQLNV